MIHLGRSNPKNVYSINNQPTFVVKFQKDLGIVITNDLSWSNHINSNCERPMKLLYLFRKVFPCPDIATSLTLYT